MSDIHTPQPAFTPPPATKPTNGLAIAGFVLGLLGFLGSFIPVINVVGIVMGVVGALLAGIGLAKAKSSGAGKGLAMTGLILGLLALVIGVVVNIAFAKAVDKAVDDVAATGVDVLVDSAVEDLVDEATGGDVDVDGEGAGGTTREKPAPLGSPVTGGDWTVTVNSVSTADEDSYGQTPDEASTLLVVNVTTTYNGDDEQGAMPWATVSYVTEDGTTIDGFDGSTVFVPEDQLDLFTTLYSGASATGNLMLEVPEAWEGGVLVVSPEPFSESTFVAVQ